jgi:hypothetical protein
MPQACLNLLSSQGLMFASRHSTTWAFLPALILSISASQVLGILSVSHCAWPLLFFYVNSRTSYIILIKFLQCPYFVRVTDKKCFSDSFSKGQVIYCLQKTVKRKETTAIYSGLFLQAKLWHFVMRLKKVTGSFFPQNRNTVFIAF